MRRNRLFALGLLALMALYTGCDEKSSGDESDPPEQALKLVIPPHASTPRVDLTYKVEPLEKSEVEAVKEPIGNAVYLPIRKCKKLHPDKKEPPRVAALEFDIVKSGADKIEAIEPKISGDEAQPAEDAAVKCLADKLKQEEVTLPSKFSKRRLHVTAQAKLHWTPM